ncbi:hypothetical protein GF406_25775 [candidate division KSB1 bacterium]|nr:hypothetical protein [candidate division KSB1 bacterium]
MCSSSFRLYLFLILWFGVFWVFRSGFGFAPLFHTDQLYSIHPKLLEQSHSDEYTLKYKLMGILAGIPAGAFVGWGIAQAIAQDDDWEHGIRGAAIGASLLPFMGFELMNHKYDAGHPQDAMRISAQTLFAFPGQYSADKRLNYALAWRKSYFMSKVWNLNFEIRYKRTRFRLGRQTVRYISPYGKSVQMVDIDFCIDYVDIALVPHVKIPCLHDDTRLGFSFGPVISTPVSDNTDFQILYKWDPAMFEGIVQFNQEYEPFGIMPFFAFTFGLELQKNGFVLGGTYFRSMGKTSQIERYREVFSVHELSLYFAYEF